MFCVQDVLRGMLDASEAERRDVAVATFAATEGSKVIAELRHHDRSTLRALLAEAFREADEDGDGTLDPSELQNVLLALVRFFISFWRVWALILMTSCFVKL